MRLEDTSAPVFARHETFHPRYGWLKRGVDAADENPEVFAREDAVVTLGVGKNMVRAIRHWGLATRVLSAVPNPDRPRVPLIRPSGFGMALLGPGGLDPYTEDPASLWALHWKLLSPGGRVPVWWIALNEFPGVLFSHDELEAFTLDYLGRLRMWDPPHPASVRKDVACFLRMYTAALGGARATAEDGVDCPFRHLGLLRAEAGTFRFDLGDKPGLSPEVVLFACLDYMARIEPQARSATVNRLANEPGAPGRAFKLSEDALEHILARANKRTATVQSVSGVAQLIWSGDSAVLARTALWNHYSRTTGAQRPDTPVGGWLADAAAAAGNEVAA